MVSGKGAIAAPRVFVDLDPNVMRQQVKKATKSQEYKSLCESIAPVIAQVIDERGGVGYLGDVNADERVKEAIANAIPEGAGFSKKIKNIVELFPDFISYFDGGRVATAKAYECGIVNMDGTINEDMIPSKKQAKATMANPVVASTKPVAENKSQKPVVAKLPKNSVLSTLDPNMAKTSVASAAKELRDACNNGTDEELEKAYLKALQVRHANSDKTVQEVINVCVATIRKSESPEEKGMGITMSKLACRPEVQPLKPVFGSKFGKFIETHSHAFVVTRDERLGPIVAVNPSYVPAVENKAETVAPYEEQVIAPQTYQTGPGFKGHGKKGAGKGGKNGKRARPY